MRCAFVTSALRISAARRVVKERKHCVFNGGEDRVWRSSPYRFASDAQDRLRREGRESLRCSADKGRDVGYRDKARRHRRFWEAREEKAVVRSAGSEEELESGGWLGKQFSVIHYRLAICRLGAGCWSDLRMTFFGEASSPCAPDRQRPAICSLFGRSGSSLESPTVRDRFGFRFQLQGRHISGGENVPNTDSNAVRMSDALDHCR